jgi:hypothetical protein
MRIKLRVRHYEEGFRSAARHRGEGAIKPLGAARLLEQKFQSQRARYALHGIYGAHVDWVGRVGEGCHNPDLGNGFLEEFEPLARRFHSYAVRQSCDVPAGVREAFYEPEPNRVANTPHDDGNCCRGLPGRHS